MITAPKSIKMPEPPPAPGPLLIIFGVVLDQFRAVLVLYVRWKHNEEVV